LSDDLIVVAAIISQWRCRFSACVRAHGGHFLWFNVFREFLKLHGFYCLTVLFVIKI